MTIHAYNVFDTILLLIVILWSFDALRQAKPGQELFRSLSFMIIAIGAFGCIVSRMHDTPPSWYAVSMHLGIAMHAVLRWVYRNKLNWIAYWRGHHVGILGNSRNHTR
jgi:ABC-type uncharacterized transport system permease subunit